ATATPRLSAPLLACARGELPANVALAQLLMAANDVNEAKAAMAQVLRDLEAHNQDGARRLEAIVQLWERTPAAFSTVKTILNVVDERDNSSERTPGDWAAIFDRAAEISSPASVALYSLGSAD